MTMANRAAARGARGWVLLLAALLAAAFPVAAESGPAQPNAAHVTGVSWFPAEFQKGYDLVVKVVLAAGFEPQGMTLRYCRVPSFACGPELPVTGTPETDYAAVIHWDAAFFLPETRHVGLNVTVTGPEGVSETSPTAHWPEAPSDLAAGAPFFYFVTVAEEADATSPAAGGRAPGPGVGVALLAVAGLLGIRRGR